MAQVKLLPLPRRSCEESLAFRATVSPPHLRRILPKPALPPLPGPNPIQVLRELLAYEYPEPVWQRIGRRALDENDPTEIAKAIKSLSWAKAQHEACQVKLHKLLPKLYPKPAA